MFACAIGAEDCYLDSALLGDRNWASASVDNSVIAASIKANELTVVVAKVIGGSSVENETVPVLTASSKLTNRVANVNYRCRTSCK